MYIKILDKHIPKPANSFEFVAIIVAVYRKLFNLTIYRF